MKNQVIRIIFDDGISHAFAGNIAKDIIEMLSDVAAIEVYEEEFTDEDNENGEKQRQGIE